MLVAGAFLDGVALGALGLEDLLSSGWIAGRRLIERSHVLRLGLLSLLVAGVVRGFSGVRNRKSKGNFLLHDTKV